MILTRTPLRISFCGGGSDVSSFYEEHGGCVISAAIDKYVYISLSGSFDPSVSLLKYSKVETVPCAKAIEHPIIRECLMSSGIEGIEMSSIADVPAGTGLGSSGSFTVGLINALSAYRGIPMSNEDLAKGACDIEIVKLGEPIGKQDQYAAAYGGLNYYRFKKDGSVSVEPLNLGGNVTAAINGNLMLFYTGITRSASKILTKQKDNISSGGKNLLEMCRLTDTLRKELTGGNIDSLGVILDKGWQLKRTVAGVSDPFIDGIYERALRNGATGGKLLGAGGGGFLLFYVPKEHQKSVRSSLSDLRLMPFRFDTAGSKVVYSDKIID